MGLRRGNGPGGVKTGLQIDCMVCHGGSIGGTSYVGLGNTTLDLKSLLDDLTRADGRRLPPSLFTLNTHARDGQRGDDLGHPHQPAQPRPLDAHRSRCRSPPTSPRWTSRLVDPRPQGDHVLRRPDRRPIGPLQHAVPPGREVARRVQGPGADLPRHPGVPEEPQAPQVSLPDRPEQGRPGPGRLRPELRQVPRHLRPRRRVSQQDRRPGRDRHRPGACPGHLRPPDRPLQLHLVRRGVSRRRDR